MKLRGIQLSYLLGISLVLTGIIYFFAANWGYFDRTLKVSLAVGLLILFYLLHFLLKKTLMHRPFLSNLSLFAASIVFGVVVALIGQTYNSHADSYQLFFIWLVPVLGLSVVTRYTPFYVLSFILTNLTMVLFAFPSSFLPDWPVEVLFAFLIIIGLVNAGAFFLTYRNWLESKTILYLSYIMTLAVFFNIATNPEFPIYPLLNFGYALLLILAGYFFLKVKQNKSLFTITVVFATSFFIYRTFAWVLMYGAVSVFYFLLLIAVALTFASAVTVGVLIRKKMNRYLINTLIVAITLITTLFATIAITGIFFLIFPGGTMSALYFFSVLILIIPGLLMVRVSEQIRYTMLGTGFILAYTTSFFVNQLLYELILLILLSIGVYLVKTKGIKVLIYLFANVMAGSILIQFVAEQPAVLILFALNLSYFLLQKKDRSTNYAAFTLILLNFMSLTFLDVQLGLQIFYNFAFLFGVLALILTLNRERHAFKWTVSLIFWFVFIGYNYYEYLWSLIHKSIVAVLLGVILIGVAAYIERRTGQTESETKPITYVTPLLVVLILLQLGFIGYQTIANEQLLANGDLIKLELQPLDARSLLQGDYVKLRYEINDLEIAEEDGWSEKIKVLLRETDGVYDYADNYLIDNKWHKPYEEMPGDVIINGNIVGYNLIRYGIESYFVEEGTGEKPESTAAHAYVRVGETGNALIEYIE